MSKKSEHHQTLDPDYIRKEKIYILCMFLGIFVVAIIAIGLIAYTSFFGMRFH